MHFAAAWEEADVDWRRRAAQAVMDTLGGKWPEHPVNPAVRLWVTMETRQEGYR